MLVPGHTLVTVLSSKGFETRQVGKRLPVGARVLQLHSMHGPKPPPAGSQHVIVIDDDQGTDGSSEEGTDGSKNGTDGRKGTATKSIEWKEDMAVSLLAYAPEDVYVMSTAEHDARTALTQGVIHTVTLALLHCCKYPSREHTPPHLM